jgi:hypothetical protein
MVQHDICICNSLHAVIARHPDSTHRRLLEVVAENAWPGVWQIGNRMEVTGRACDLVAKGLKSQQLCRLDKEQVEL